MINIQGAWIIQRKSKNKLAEEIGKSVNILKKILDYSQKIRFVKIKCLAQDFEGSLKHQIQVNLRDNFIRI